VIVSFQVRLERFSVWRGAVVFLVSLAVLVVVAWAVALEVFRTADGSLLVPGVAALLTAAALVIGRSLAAVEPGILSCRDGVWTYAADRGPSRSGPLTVAVDLGSFLLLRMGAPNASPAWLPVQRRGLEREWHALRCAVYSPPPVAGGSPTAPHSPPE
jgi:hypothetical protein